MFVALENLRSLHNIGAIFRTCSYFGVDDVLLVGYTGKRTNTKGQIVLHEEVKKSALGTEEKLNLIFIKDSLELIAYTQEHDLKLIAVEQNIQSMKLTKWVPDAVIYLFGLLLKMRLSKKTGTTKILSW
jgi:tRNA G18 (ribose-2'-O)-methylase SpoU